MGCQKYAHFFGTPCPPKEQVDSHCRIMRLAYLWPGLIVALRSTLMILAAAFPVVLLCTMPLEMGTGSSLIVIGVGALMLIIWGTVTACEKWQEGKYERKRRRQEKRDRRRDLREERGPSRLALLLNKGYREICPLIQFEEDRHAE